MLPSRSRSLRSRAARARARRIVTAQYWCELAWLGGNRTEPGVLVAVDGDRITDIRYGANSGAGARPEGAVPLRGLTIPALANAHSHAFHRALRGRTHGGPGTFWTWRDLMYRVAARLDPDRYHRLARAVFAEMALAGIGVVGEFHYVHHRPDGSPYDDPGDMGAALVAAACDAGIRLTLLNTLYLHGGLDPVAARGYASLRPEQARFSDGTAERWADRTEALVSALSGPATMVGAAVHSVRAVDPPSMEVAADWSRERGAPLHFHVSEQPAENEQCLGVHGRTPVEMIALTGGLGPGTTLVHATHATPRDVQLIGEAGALCCLCPTTERDLADGVGPSPDLARAGVGLCLGSDSHATVDILEEARTIELDQRAATHGRGVFGVDALASMATSSGYRSLGWQDGGRLEPGALADFATVGLDSVRMAGVDAANALPASVFAAGGADVHHLVVGGKTVVRNGSHTTVNAATELASAISEVTEP